MIINHVRRIGAPLPSTINVEIIIEAIPPSFGIQKVQVLDNDNNLVVDFDGECSLFFSRVLSDISKESLPIFLRVVECPSPDSEPPLSGEVTISPPLLAEERLGDFRGVICLPLDPRVSGISPNANNQACIEQNTAVNSLRNEILRLCDEASNLRGQRDAAAAAGVAFGVAAAAAFGAAAAIAGIPFVGQLLVWVVIGVAIALLVAALAAAASALAFEIALNDKLGEVNEAQRRFQDAASQLSTVCCPEYITADTESPTCS
ncbi:hypothetical protein [Dapis sp. BLCC M229]|uniref:hypothetical protein n=1 Tax=Dapis sp. BLCC M229 TaxID=3400188 RepID=UPI003CF3416E